MMIFYKDSKWRQRKSLVGSLPVPKNCIHCGESAYLYLENTLWWSGLGFIECQNRKLDGCKYNHYSGGNIKEIIDLWNDHNTE